MKSKLKQSQRLIVAFAYVITIVVAYSVLGGPIADILNQKDQASVWFFSGILLVIMGKYVTEPYFSSPSDTLSNSISLTLFLTTLINKNELIGYWFLIVYSLSMFFLSIIHIVLKNTSIKFKRISFYLLKSVGSSKCMFSAIYLLAAYSYFQTRIPMLVVSIAIWISLAFCDVYELLLKWLTGLWKSATKKKSAEIGVAVKNNNDNIFHVEIPKDREDMETIFSSRNELFAIKTAVNTYSVALCVDTKMLLKSIWIELLLLNENGKHISFDKSDADKFGIILLGGEELGSTFMLNKETIDTVWWNRIVVAPEYSRMNSFIGFILPDSNISLIRFSICRAEDGIITEGSIVETAINGKKTLYQVVNGVTKEESNLTMSSDGYMCALARKLGVYNYESMELQSAKWTPYTNEPVYLCNTNESTDFKNIANTAIGHLPLSDMRIPIKDINALVTHNTAILGILGVGKSCLTFELIKKIVSEGIKVVCIDITNQYGSGNGLSAYIPSDVIQDDLEQREIDSLKNSSTKTGSDNVAEQWGNLGEYKNIIERYLKGFLSDTNTKKNVFILNPDNHEVKKAATAFKISESVDVSVVEKTKIISEKLLKTCMDMGQTQKARCCIVFEEAHSLTPEWNSVVNSGDEKHSNGTAKVILQGRKYGLGCILVTQRTANVTKSILNQCNTIFALRVFDDTGKSFLENYIGKDYSDVLPTLEERHAVAIGKGLKLKQPVIIQLNDAKYVREEFVHNNDEICCEDDMIIESEID